jgi:hypothetical protein
MLKFKKKQNPWKEAVIDACIVRHLSWDDKNPRKTLSHLLAYEVQLALDPRVSQEAQNLIDRGKASK